MQWFQYRILHRILGTNSLLFKMNIIGSNLCTFCKMSSETIEHLFHDCQLVLDFWKMLSQWISNKIDINIPIDKRSILFGIPKKHAKVINWLIINIKQYIYNMKMQETRLNIYALQNILQSKMYSEKYILLKNCRYKEYKSIWYPWFNLFN